jgi:MFS family permease
MSVTDTVEAAPAGTRAKHPLLRLYPSLGNPVYRLLWLGSLPSVIAWQMGVIASPYAAFKLEGTATILGVVSVSTGVPMVLLSLVGGVVADRLPRLRVVMASQAMLFGGAALLAGLTLAGQLQVWHLVAFGFVQGIAFSFNMPARQAYIADVVGPALLRNAVALNNAGVNFSRVVGPAIAGALIAAPGLGIGGAFAGMAFMYLLVLLSLLRLPLVPPAIAGAAGSPLAGAGQRATPPDASQRPPSPKKGSWAQLLEGLAYIRDSAVLRALLGMAFLTVFFGMPFQSLLPLFSERVFDVGAAGLGAMMAAFGVGSLAGALGVAALPAGLRPAQLQLGLGIGFGLTLTAFALAPAYPLAVAALALVGVFSSGYTALNSTMIMTNAEPRLYGRVMSVYLLTFAMMPFGALPMAYAADHVGGPITIAAAGLLVAGSVAAIALLYPPYRRIR